MVYFGIKINYFVINPYILEIPLHNKKDIKIALIEGFDQRNIKSQIKNHSNYDRNILLTNDEIFGEETI